jgi:hypothetical protein
LSISVSYAVAISHVSYFRKYKSSLSSQSNYKLRHYSETKSHFLTSTLQNGYCITSPGITQHDIELKISFYEFRYRRVLRVYKLLFIP